MILYYVVNTYDGRQFNRGKLFSGYFCAFNIFKLNEYFETEHMF